MRSSDSSSASDSRSTKSSSTTLNA
ncbi:unnamed protein product, partial [Rotaria magnacalcarata]